MWIIEYGDERGNQASNRYATAAEALEGLEAMGSASRAMAETIRDQQVSEGYSLQTHSFHAYSEEWGNHTIYVLDLDTHDRDGYELESEATEVPATAVGTLTERAAVLQSMLYGLTMLSNAKPSMFIEWTGGADDPVVIRQTDGWTMTLNKWYVHLFPHTVNVTIIHDGEETTYPPMDALVYLGSVICTYRD